MVNEERSGGAAGGMPAGGDSASRRRLRMALVGGGGSGFIGRVHAVAAQLDGEAELVAGALSSDPQRSRAAAADFGIAPERAYGDVHELLSAESTRDDPVDFVTIATPNHTHYELAKSVLEAGFDLFCDKPLTTRGEDARTLVQLADRARRVVVVTHNYTGYPLVRQMREMVGSGELGEILAVRVHYIQGWLQGLPPGAVPARGAWKADPKLAGPSGALADIGTHAYNLVRYVSSLAPRELACTLSTFHPERVLDDYAMVWLRLGERTLGNLLVSQVTHGRANDLRLEIDGTRAAVAWQQETPDELVVRRFGQPVQIYQRHPAAAYAAEACRRACRIPWGHPEGFLEAFANVYRAGFEAIRSRQAGHSPVLQGSNYPNILDGLEGVLFVERALASARAGGEWLPLDAVAAR